MALWGKSTSAESRPKFLGGDGAIQKKEECFATTRGWEIKAGTKASGNDNANAQPELLVAIGGLSTVLGAANLFQSIGLMVHMLTMVLLTSTLYLHMTKQLQ